MNTSNAARHDRESGHARMMKACRILRFGGPDVITVEEIAIPEPAAGEVLVRVKAAGAGPWDAWIRAGKSALPQPLPLTLGADLCGTIEAVGAEASDFSVGDEIFGVTNARFTGAQAEYAVASATSITMMPPRLTAGEAASVPVVAVTAQQALSDEAHLIHGQKVLIHGAAGNVGAYAVQLARDMGLHVSATASAKDLGYLRDLGADTVIDFRADRFEEVATGMDAVIDLVGGETQTRSFDVLKPGGVLVSAVSQPDQQLAERYGVRAHFFLVAVTAAQLARIAELIEAGKLKTSVGAVLPLSDVRIVHEMFEGLRPRPRGKLVFRLGDASNG